MSLKKCKREKNKTREGRKTREKGGKVKERNS